MPFFGKRFIQKMATCRASGDTFSECFGFVFVVHLIKISFESISGEKIKQAIGRKVHGIAAEQVADRRHLMAAVQFLKRINVSALWNLRQNQWRIYQNNAHWRTHTHTQYLLLWFFGATSGVYWFAGLVEILWPIKNAFCCWPSRWMSYFSRPTFWVTWLPGARLAKAPSLRNPKKVLFFFCSTTTSTVPTTLDVTSGFNESANPYLPRKKKYIVINA